MSKKSGKFKVRYLFEAIIAYPIFYILKYTPLFISAFVFGNIAKNLGQCHSSNKTAIKNLKNAFPKKSPDEIKKIAKLAWYNLGATVAQFPRISSLSAVGLQKLCDMEEVKKIYDVEENKKGVIFVSAHYCNWELASRMLVNVEPKTALVYRNANNQLVENLMTKARRQYANLIIPKGDVAGFKAIYKHLKQGGALGMLVDQKLREGQEVKFFGRNVMAPVTAAELAIKFKYPLIMGRLTKDERGKYKAHFEAPIDYAGLNAQELTQKIYDKYEDWIREYPENWFWMHNRWPN